MKLIDPRSLTIAYNPRFWFLRFFSVKIVETNAIVRKDDVKEINIHFRTILVDCSTVEWKADAKYLGLQDNTIIWNKHEHEILSKNCLHVLDNVFRYFW